MSKKTVISFLMLILFISLLLVGCSSRPEQPIGKLESGVLDEDYQGVVNPEIPKELKLTEEEAKNGIKKITIKCGVEKELPVENSQEKSEVIEDVNNNNEKGVSDEAKPKI